VTNLVQTLEKSDKYLKLLDDAENKAYFDNTNDSVDSDFGFEREVSDKKLAYILESINSN
jgi:hypothetical protein